jgi:hypothetical protein
VTHGAHGEVILRVGEAVAIGEHGQRLQQRRFVVERFAHAHEDDRVRPLGAVGERHLRHDLPGREVAQQAEPARFAERAGAGAADLRRYTQTRAPAAHRQVHTLDGAAVLQAQQPFAQRAGGGVFVLFGRDLGQVQVRVFAPPFGGEAAEAKPFRVEDTLAHGGPMHGGCHPSPFALSKPRARGGGEVLGAVGEQIQRHRCRLASGWPCINFM